jgi:4-amino-4-deoxy-L-arabinose transferase-like glycosyltransferase
MGLGTETRRWDDDRIFWIFVFSFFLLTRFPAMAQYLSIDNVNLAFALEKFDLVLHQPQPPGYPLFVAFTRVINLAFHDAEKSFVVVSLLVSALSLPLILGLGNRMFGIWVGRAAVLLLLTNPPFWHTTIDGPLRPTLALFSLLTAYCAWRAWTGEKEYVIYGAVALGVGSGFRPDLGAYLFPLWLVSAWAGTRSLSAVLRGIAVIAAIVFVWLGAVIYAAGGVREAYRISVDYVLDQSKLGSVVFGASGRASLRQVSRLLIWNVIGAVGWLWAVPLYWRNVRGRSLGAVRGIFLAIWALPGLILQAFVHVDSPGHTLFSIPALCLGGAFIVATVTQNMGSVKETLLAGLLLINTMLFLGFIALPAPDAPAGGWHSAKNALIYGTFETSLDEVRWRDDISRVTLKEIRQLTPPDRPAIIVSSDIHYRDWFVNWRIARYYFPSADFWVVADQQNPPAAEHVRRDRRVLETRGGPVPQIPVPRGGRVIWLLERGGPFDTALRQVHPELPRGTYVSYLDVPQDAESFRVLDFEFVPTHGSAPGASQ